MRSRERMKANRLVRIHKRYKKDVMSSKVLSLANGFLALNQIYFLLKEKVSSYVA